MVGFYHETGPGFEWDAEYVEALQTSRALVCLLSPAYFHDDRVGKEWQVFEMRRRRSASSMSLAEIVVPISWNLWHGPVPTVISEMLANPDRVYQDQAIVTMLKSSGKLWGEYAGFVRTLANRMVEMATKDSPPPLDPLLSAGEISNPFHLWEYPAERSRSNEQSNGRYVNDDFADRPVDSSGPTGDREFSQSGSRGNPGTGAGFGAQPQQTTHHRAESDKPRIFVIDGDEDGNRALVESLPLADFRVERFAEAERASDKLFSDDLRHSAPDLFIVDLHLKPGKMQGLDFIKKLIDKPEPVPSSIMVISQEQGDLEQVIKAGAIGIKGLNHSRLLEKMRRLADYGKKRRLYKTGSKDESRQVRPIFLSFSSHHKRVATGLKAHIEGEGLGVWFAPDLLGRDHPWQQAVIEGIDQAQIFLAFITEGFLRSHACIEELRRFAERARTDPDNALLVPILYGWSGESEKLRNDDEVKSILDGYECIDFSGTAFMSGFHVVEHRIRKQLFHRGRTAESSTGANPESMYSQ
jgi:FixJ family two-component response regulator